MRHNHQIQAYKLVLMAACRLSDLPLNPIPYDGGARDLARHYQTYAHMR